MAEKWRIIASLRVDLADLYNIFNQAMRMGWATSSSVGR
jgi:hypothetical protein